MEQGESPSKSCTADQPALPQQHNLTAPMQGSTASCLRRLHVSSYSLPSLVPQPLSALNSTSQLRLTQQQLHQRRLHPRHRSCSCQCSRSAAHSRSAVQQQANASHQRGKASHRSHAALLLMTTCKPGRQQKQWITQSSSSAVIPHSQHPTHVHTQTIASYSCGSQAARPQGQAGTHKHGSNSITSLCTCHPAPARHTHPLTGSTAQLLYRPRLDRTRTRATQTSSR